MINKTRKPQLNILAVSGSAFTVTPPNVVLDCGNAKIVFDKQPDSGLSIVPGMSVVPTVLIN